MTSRAAIPTLAATLLRLAMLALTLYGAVLGWLWFSQEKLLFVPTVLPADRPLAQAPDIHEVTIDVAGARLSALHLRLPNPKGVVFFLHGNGGSLESWFVNADFHRRANFDLFMIDYRGYGKSTGRIESEAQLRQDVRSAWATVAPRYAGKRVVIYGRSLGSGLAAGLSVELASTRAPDLTVLVSPYSSMAALSHDHYPWVPSFVLRYPMRTDQMVGHIGNPVLLIHGTEDRLIAVAIAMPQGTGTARRPVAHRGRGCNDLQDFEAYRSGFADALARL
ncbi:MAG: alpha/beta fold hydrolase [Rhodoferax sp.]|nr:alpha/beta fold hydrolase [Rhodoferax sp.]